MRTSGLPCAPLEEAPALADRPDLAGHPRAEFAAGIRDHPRVVGYQDPRRSALAVISTGIAGLTELSFELEPGHRGAGGGARLASEVLSTVPSGQIAGVFLQQRPSLIAHFLFHIDVESVLAGQGAERLDFGGVEYHAVTL